VTYDIAWRLDQAIRYVVDGKAADWQQTLHTAMAHDPDTADAYLRRSVQRRLRSLNGFDPKDLSGVVRLSEQIAQSFAGTDFSVPAYLIEFVIRRALDETGCCDFLDHTEVAFAATQLCAALDARLRLFPPGWSSGVYVRI
jgi:hypothetical protein